MQVSSGALVAISWPDTRIHNAGSWYDGFMKLLGICKPDGYYHVGHAALLLVDYRTGEVRYFDFGRYHTPLGYGRVRDMQSDPELTIATKAHIEGTSIGNVSEILLELQDNRSTHGDGKLVCSMVSDIDFDMAVASAKSIQARGAIPYGPFQPFGSNCSRFVASIYKSSVSSLRRKLKISNLYLYFHTPASNVIYTHVRDNVFVAHHGEVHKENNMLRVFNNKIGNNIVSKALSQSDELPRSIDLPAGIKELSGIGGNTYFLIDPTEKKHQFRVRRYSEYGILEIDDIFQLVTIGFDITKPYQIDYISNGIGLHVLQSKKVYELKNLKYKRQSMPDQKRKFFQRWQKGAMK